MRKEKKIDTRLEDHLFALVDTYSKRHGLKRTQVVVMALEKFFGLQHADPVEFARGKILTVYPSDTPKTLRAAEKPGEICELPDSGSSPVRIPIRYPKPTKRKSSS